MHQLIYILEKEFRQIIRNRAILPLLTAIPIVQLILLSFAATNEIRNVNIAITDQDHSDWSRQLIGKIRATNIFSVVSAPLSSELAGEDLQSGDVDVVLTIPPHFQRDFLRERGGTIQLQVNAINGQQATIGAAYLQRIIGDFNREILHKISLPQQQPVPQLAVTYANWYNPELDYKTFMVPGILGVLVTVIVLLLSGMNIVREREIGTIEQVNVSPIKSWQFIAGKMIPFLIIGLIDLTVGLSIGKLIFDIPMVGNLALVFGYCVINILAVLGIGLLISNFADTQQQAMFIAWFFMMVFILMSGLFTPIESMPKWAQWMTVPNPLAHFVHVMRHVLLKGSTFAEVQYQFGITAILAVVFNVLAVWTFRKREG